MTRAVVDGGLPALVDAAADGFERAGWSAERVRARVLLAAMAAAAGPSLVRAAIATAGDGRGALAWSVIAGRAAALGREGCEAALARAGGGAGEVGAALERALAAGRGGAGRSMHALRERVLSRLPGLLGLPLLRLRGGRSWGRALASPPRSGTCGGSPRERRPRHRPRRAGG